MNIEESEKLIRKAIDKDREQRKKIDDLPKDEDVDNPAYLDSLGWVLFKKKDYKEAKKYLLEATKLKGGEHIEIYDHLADAHMALGEKAEAIKVWKDALKLDRSRIQVGHISPFGLLEMSRQRIRQGMVETSMVPCPSCGGTGHVRSTPSVALHCLRALEEHLLKNGEHHVTVRCSTAVARSCRGRRWRP